MKITVISASNRHDNKTRIFAERCVQHLENAGANAQFFSLASLPESLSIHDIYEFDANDFTRIVEKYIRPVNKFAFVVPEYNGSYPGILKMFIDGIPPAYFSGKKAALVGISSGRSGNIRGLDHLTSVLYHLQTMVLPERVYISRIDELLRAGEIDPATDGLLQKCIGTLVKA